MEARMSQTTQNAGLSQRFENAGEMRIAGLSGRFGPHNRDQIPALWMRWGPKYFGATPGQVDKKSYGVCWNMDGRGGLDYLAGVEVKSFDGVPAELTQMTLQPQRYAVFPHAGHISTINQTWMDIFDKWLPKSGAEIAQAPSFERYDEAFDPAVAIGGVEIWIPVKG
jgi:AraC family transcriptional regulator